MVDFDRKPAIGDSVTWSCFTWKHYDRRSFTSQWHSDQRLGEFLSINLWHICQCAVVHHRQVQIQSLTSLNEANELSKMSEMSTDFRLNESELYSLAGMFSHTKTVTCVLSVQGLGGQAVSSSAASAASSSERRGRSTSWRRCASFDSTGGSHSPPCQDTLHSSVSNLTWPPRSVQGRHDPNHGAVPVPVLHAGPVQLAAAAQSGTHTGSTHTGWLWAERWGPYNKRGRNSLDFLQFGIREVNPNLWQCPLDCLISTDSIFWFSKMNKMRTERESTLWRCVLVGFEDKMLVRLWCCSQLCDSDLI